MQERVMKQSTWFQQSHGDTCCCNNTQTNVNWCSKHGIPSECGYNLKRDKINLTLLKYYVKSIYVFITEQQNMQFYYNKTGVVKKNFFNFSWIFGVKEEWSQEFETPMHSSLLIYIISFWDRDEKIIFFYVSYST